MKQVNTNFDFDDKWLEEAILLEEELDCDISAGFDWGVNTASYIAGLKGHLDQAKLTEILQEQLGNLLEQDEIEKIVQDIQNRVNEKLQFAESA
jgi:predicted DNA-binding protein (UPF0278 family)